MIFLMCRFVGLGSNPLEIHPWRGRNNLLDGEGEGFVLRCVCFIFD